MKTALALVWMISAANSIRRAAPSLQPLKSIATLVAADWCMSIAHTHTDVLLLLLALSKHGSRAPIARV